MFICAHCNNDIAGPAYVHPDGKITHDGHAASYQRAKRGLDHECPACGGRGRVRDMGRPVERSEMVPNPNAWGSGTGLMEERHTTYPHDKPCDLCNGEGYLSKPPIPVTEMRQTEWRRA